MQLPSWILVSFAFQDHLHPPIPNTVFPLGQITCGTHWGPSLPVAFSSFFLMFPSSFYLLTLPFSAFLLTLETSFRSRAPSQGHPPTSALLLHAHNPHKCPSQLLKDRNARDGRVKWLMPSNTGQKKMRTNVPSGTQICELMNIMAKFQKRLLNRQFVNSREKAAVITAPG